MDLTGVEITRMIKNFVAVNGTISKKEARNYLGITPYQSDKAFDNLVRQGHLRGIDYGVYQFVGTIQKPPVTISDKIWRAMKILPRFSAREVAKLASSTLPYVYKRFRVYRSENLIRQAGVRTVETGGVEKVWRLTQAGKKKAQNPREFTWKSDPLNKATVVLNRLVCSGVAVRDKAAAQEALAQLEIIRDGLSLVVEEG